LWWLMYRLYLLFVLAFVLVGGSEVDIDSRKYYFVVDPKQFDGEDSVGRLLQAQKFFVDMGSLGANIPGFALKTQSGGEDLVHEIYYDDSHSGIQRRNRAIVFRQYITSYSGRSNELSVEVISADPVYAHQPLKHGKNISYVDDLCLITRVFTSYFQFSQKILLGQQIISPTTFSDLYPYFPDSDLYSKFAISATTSVVPSRDIYRYSVVREGTISGSNATFVLAFDYDTFDKMKVNEDVQLVQFYYLIPKRDSYTLLDSAFSYFQSGAMTKWSNEKSQILSVTLSGWVIFIIILAIFLAILVASLIAFCIGKRRGAYQNLL